MRPQNSNFWPSKNHCNSYFHFWSQKLQKSRFGASPNPPKIRRTARRCPGVSDQYALSTSFKYLFYIPKGDPAMPPTTRSALMLEPCWRHFSSLGVSWAHFALLAAFVVALGWFFCVLDHSGLDFGGFGEVPGMVFQAPGPHFLMFFLDCELSMRQSS